MKLYQDRYNNAKVSAQDQLIGRTHYVDESTLRFHHSRVLDFNIHADGLLCSIVESVSLDMDNTERGFRYVIFDIFGTVQDRVNLDDTFKSKLIARKALAEALKKIDAIAVTLEGIESMERNHASEIKELRNWLINLSPKKAA